MSPKPIAFRPDSGVQSMAYDFLRGSKDEPLLTEMSYIYLDQPIAQCEGHWDRNMTWIPGRTPQAAQVEDFLDRIAGRPMSADQMTLSSR